MREQNLSLTSANTPPLYNAGKMNERRLDYLLMRATTVALRGVFHHGVDLPVGAAAAYEGIITNQDYAHDTRLNRPEAHAEFMAIDGSFIKPDTVVVTLEPCRQCQDFLATQPSVKTVAFGLNREDAAARGLVRPHGESIFDRAERIGLPYNIIEIENQKLKQRGRIILDHTKRNIDTGHVTIDKKGLASSLRKHYEAA